MEVERAFIHTGNLQPFKLNCLNILWPTKSLYRKWEKGHGNHVGCEKYFASAIILFCFSDAHESSNESLKG